LGQWKRLRLVNASSDNLRFLFTCNEDQATCSAPRLNAKYIFSGGFDSDHFYQCDEYVMFPSPQQTGSTPRLHQGCECEMNGSIEYEIVNWQPRSLALLGLQALSSPGRRKRAAPRDLLRPARKIDRPLLATRPRHCVGIFGRKLTPSSIKNSSPWPRRTGSRSALCWSGRWSITCTTCPFAAPGEA